MNHRTIFATVLTALGAWGSQAAWAVPQVQVHGPRPGVAAADLDAALGTYVLSNGQTLNLSGRQPRFLARLGNREAVALHATGPDTYEAVDGSLRVQLAPQANGQVNDLKVTYRP